jgi:hypothetical protein
MITIVTIIALIVLFMYVATHVPIWVYSLMMALWCTVAVVINVFRHDQVGIGLNVLMGSYWWHRFWKNKPPKMRDKAANLIGAKAKAIRDKLVAAMPKVSPVRIPQLAPVGA